MKKLFLIFLCLITINTFSQTPIKTIRVANATTAFGENLVDGTRVYNVATEELWIANTGVVNSATLTTASDSFYFIMTDKFPFKVDATNNSQVEFILGRDTIKESFDFEYPQYALVSSASDYATTALDNLASVAINESLISDTDNTDALGSTAINWSDLFLGDGGVIDWDNGNVKITHSAGLLTLSSDLTLAVNNSIRLSGAGGIEILSSIGRDADNYISWDSDDKLAIMIGSERHDFRSISDGAADKDKLVTQGYVDDAVLTTVNWTTWTPSIVWTSTGADPSSVSGVYRYSQIEKTVNFTMAITATMNSGTTQVTATLPVTPKDVNILVPVIAGSTIDVIGYVDAANNESSLRLLTLVFTIPSGTITFYVSGFYEVE